jgi:hypothetical protein
MEERLGTLPPVPLTGQGTRYVRVRPIWVTDRRIRIPDELPLHLVELTEPRPVMPTLR